AIGAGTQDGMGGAGAIMPAAMAFSSHPAPSSHCNAPRSAMVGASCRLRLSLADLLAAVDLPPQRPGPPTLRHHMPLSAAKCNNHPRTSAKRNDERGFSALGKIFFVSVGYKLARAGARPQRPFPPRG